MFSASKSGQYQGYQISRSVRLRSSASAYFNRNIWTSANRTTWTASIWIKRGILSSLQTIMGSYDGVSANASKLYFTAGNALAFDFGGSATNTITTSAVFRDPSAWYHIVLSIDTTQATAANRIGIYVNGVQQTTTGTPVAQNTNTLFWVTSNNAFFGLRSADYLDGYLAEINVVNGQALTPSSFGVTNAYGVWSPTKYNGTYGTNGFYLNFSDNSGATATTIGKDSSGNGNNWTPNNISVTDGVTYDSMLDVPTPWGDGGNGRGNYAVINPLNNSGGVTISDGNLKALWASASNRSVLSTFPIPSTGKFYAEFVNGTLTSASVAVAFGLATEGSSRTGIVSANMWVYYASNQSYISRNGTLSSQIGTNQTIAAGGILQVAIDRDNNQAWLGYNNVWINSTNGTTGDPSAGTNPTVSSLPADLFVMVGLYAENGNVNFGQRPFSYTRPTGFNALNTFNLPEPSIQKGNQYFDVSLYTGNGTTQTVTNSGGFTPDLVWNKGRSVAYSHGLVDSVRGNSNILSSNTTAAESNPGAQLDITTNGFISTYRAANLANNQNAATYVGWQWKAGVSAVTNTAGTITSTVDAGTTQGFSIVTYTGTGANATVGHGLGVTPAMMICKARSGGVENWYVWHKSISGSTPYIYLNLTNAAVTGDSTRWTAAPTSTVINLGSNSATNGSGYTYVTYLFAEVAGFSRFGSYTGNGSTDGPFVFCGFRPRWVMMKRTDTTGSWYVVDTSRDTYNVMSNDLYPNLSSAEGVFATADVTANGFKLRNTGVDMNASGGTYIFAAFAENPFKYSLAR